MLLKFTRRIHSKGESKSDELIFPPLGNSFSFSHLVLSPPFAKDWLSMGEGPGLEFF